MSTSLKGQIKVYVLGYIVFKKTDLFLFHQMPVFISSEAFFCLHQNLKVDQFLNWLTHTQLIEVPQYRYIVFLLFVVVDEAGNQVALRGVGGQVSQAGLVHRGHDFSPQIGAAPGSGRQKFSGPFGGFRVVGVECQSLCGRFVHRGSPYSHLSATKQAQTHSASLNFAILRQKM